eukprot:1176911-Amphidinium_carterae.1
MLYPPPNRLEQSGFSQTLQSSIVVSGHPVKDKLHPNVSNVTLDIPELPTPPDCDVDAVSVHP